MEFIVITATNTYDIVKKCQIVGGVQTYTRDLCLLAIEKGYHAIMYQLDRYRKDADSYFDGIEFHIVNKSGNNQKAFDRIFKAKNGKDTLFVVASDQMDIKSTAPNVIVIQHGVAFDVPSVNGLWGKNKTTLHFNKFLRCLNNVRRLYWSRNTVGVDYNYFNWFRTLGILCPEKRFTVIPNYSSGQISESAFNEKMERYGKGGITKIVFARRFTEYRGTLIFANCIDRLLQRYPNLDFTFAGDGPLRGDIEKRFYGNSKVHITSFAAPKSIAFHEQYDIAIVPTVFSEGTSLSLLEAMSAGCFPIATHVGGMTNILLDHYNGLLCFPDEEGVFRALEEAISMDRECFRKICKNAYYSAVEAFSLERWKSKWGLFIDEVMCNQ